MYVPQVLERVRVPGQPEDFLVTWVDRGLGLVGLKQLKDDTEREYRLPFELIEQPMISTSKDISQDRAAVQV